jgi:hypothetical protein
MSPIDEFLAARLTRELNAAGTSGAEVSVIGGAAEDWHYQVAIGGRTFETGFNLHGPFWCVEVTAAQPRDLVSNDGIRVSTSDAARALAVRLIHRAMADPAFAAHNPPVI